MQWRELPIEVYFEKGEISWQNVYYYFNKWGKDGSFQRVWLNLLSKKKRKLDMSCVQLDGSHTRCRRLAWVWTASSKFLHESAYMPAWGEELILP